jgi:hypothetical protein
MQVERAQYEADLARQRFMLEERVFQDAPCLQRIKISKNPGIQADFVICH